MRTGLAAAAVLMVVTAIGNWDTSGAQPSNLAFCYLGWIGFAIATAAAFATMDIICGERREGTLGLLFLTHLSGPDVVLGKFAASAFIGLLVIAGFAPVLVVTLLPGGVTGFEVARVVLALMLTLFLGLAVGVCISSRARDLLAATWMIILCLGVLLLVLPVTDAFWLFKPIAFLSLLSPVATFIRALDAPYQGAPAFYWISVALVLFESGALLVFTSRTLACNWREDFSESKTSSPKIPGSQRESTPIAGTEEQVPVGRDAAERDLKPPVIASDAKAVRPTKRLGDENPIPWLMHRQRRQPALFWIAAVIMSFVGSFGLFYRFTSSVGGGSGGALAALFQAFVSLFAEAGSAAAIAMFALAAGRFFMDARRHGTLELLLTTPIGARDLIRGQKQTLLRLLAGPIVVILLPAGATLLILVCFREAMSDQLAPWYAANLVLYAIKQTLNVLTACTVGLWFGLHCRNAWTLMAWASGLTAGVQWLTTAALYVIYLLVRPDMNLGTTQVPFLWKFWEVLSPAAQLIPAFVLILWANHRIRQDLAGIAEVASPWEDLRFWLHDRLGFAPSSPQTRSYSPSNP